MTDEIQGQPQEQPDSKVIMEIILTKDGEIKVAGQIINDKTMALGVIEVAKLKLFEYWAALETKLIKPNKGIIHFMRNGHKG